MRFDTLRAMRKMISTYQLKTRFQSLLRPLAAWLFRMGVSANQITIAAGLISLLLGALAAWHPQHKYMFLLISLWCLARMAANALDGMLAREFGQASRLGAILNEVGDVVSDIALYLPFAWLAASNPWLVAAVVLLAVLSEFAGLLGAALGGERGYQGPMGKSDRALVFGFIGLLIGCDVALDQYLNGIWIVIALLLMLTIFNRCRAAMVKRGTA